MTDEHGASAKAIAIGFFEDITAGRTDDAFARLAPDVRYEVISPEPYGDRMDRDGLGRFIETYLTPKLVGSMAIDIVGVTAEDERVAIETRMHAPGKHGKDYDNRFHFLFVVRNRQIVEVREYLDSKTFVDFVE